MANKDKELTIWWDFADDIMSEPDFSDDYVRRIYPKFSKEKLSFEDMVGEVELKIWEAVLQPTRTGILKILWVLQQPVNVYELKLLLKQSYSTIQKHLNALEKLEIIKKQRRLSESGRGVIDISLLADFKSESEELKWQLENWNDYKKEVQEDYDELLKAEDAVRAHVKLNYTRKSVVEFLKSKLGLKRKKRMRKK